MDYGKMLSDSFSYAKDAVWGKWVQWILLVISTIIFPLIMGYTVRIYSGAKPAPDVGNWVRTFIDGLKLFIIGIIYSIPVFIVALIFGVPAAMAGDPATAAGTIGIGLLVVIIVGILVSLISMIGIIRFARKNSMGQAFAFGAILEHIGNAHLWSHRLCAGNDPVHRLADSAIPLPGLDHPCCTLRDADLRKRPGTGVKPHSPILF